MGVTQYIGARYVPIFYVNSNNTSEWTPNTTYEPLTIVTRGTGNSYTSKIPVPANIGEPENNPDYWVNTGNFNAQVNDLDQKVGDLETAVDGVKDMAGNKAGVWGIGRVNNTSNRHYLYFSRDGVKFDFLRVMPATMTSDLSRVCHIGDWFYYVTSRGYQKSKDLVTWSAVQLLDITFPIPGASTYGTQFFVDGNQVYMINATQYQAGNIPLNAVGATTSMYFRIDCYPVTIDENGDITTDNVSSFTTLLGGDGATSYIDPFVVKTAEYGYVMCVKNEISCQIEIYNGTSLFNMARVSMANNLYGTEGCQMIVNDIGDIMLYAHAYAPRTVSALEDASATSADCNRMPPTIMRTRITESWNQHDANTVNAFASTMLWELVDFPCDMRHPGFCVCDADAYNILSKMTAISIPRIYNMTTRFINKAQGTLVRFSNAPVTYANRYSLAGANLQGLTAEYVRIFRDPCPIYVTAQTGTATLAASSISLGAGMANAAAGRKIDLSSLTDGGEITFYGDLSAMFVPWTT